MHCLIAVITECRVKGRVVNKEFKSVSKSGAVACLDLSHGAKAKTTVTTARVRAEMLARDVPVHRRSTLHLTMMFVIGALRTSDVFKANTLIGT
jgi:hypothetical protein